MPQYKNISDKDLMLPGIGVVKAGENIEQPDGFNNANFEKVGEAKRQRPRPDADSEKKQEQPEQVEANKETKEK